MTPLEKIQNLLSNHKIDGIATRVKHDVNMLTTVNSWSASQYCDLLSEKIYCYVKQLSQPPACVCGKSVSFISITKGHREFCSKECVHAKAAATERRVKVLKENGGVGLANPKSKAKAQQTLENTYGVSNAFCLPHVDTHRVVNNPMKDPKNVERIRQQCLEQYGVDWHSKRQDVIAKTTETLNNKYGVSNPAQKNYSSLANQVLNDPVALKTMFETSNISNMAQELAVCETTILKYLKIWGIRQPNEISAELQLNSWLKAQGFVDFEKTRTTLLNKQEIDLYSESQHLGIEYCGLYWHSQRHKQRGYHKNKYIACRDQGIKLITIFEDEWLNRSQIVKSRLSQILGINKRGPGARCLRLSCISSSQATDFLNTHHISGAAKAEVAVGAYDLNQKLVAVMTFSQGRKFTKPKEVWQWEMVRFSTDGQHYAGIAARLFHHFEKTYQPQSVLSYADLRWGQGLYLAHLGFRRFEDTPPNYWYFSLKNPDFKRYHRFTFNKQAMIKKYPHLVTEGCTEYSMAQGAGLERIWDCGNAKWIWYKT
jgi:hypothetical protein